MSNIKICGSNKSILSGFTINNKRLFNNVRTKVILSLVLVSIHGKMPIKQTIE